MIALGIDPSTSSTGLAILDSEDLENPVVWNIAVEGRTMAQRRVPTIVAMSALIADIVCDYNPDIVVIEWQAIRKSTQQNRTPPNDVLECVGLSGAAAGCLMPDQERRLVLPVMWKGSVPKKIHNKRVLAQLDMDTSHPCFCMVPRAKLNDCIDALGLALWAIKGCGRPV